MTDPTGSSPNDDPRNEWLMAPEETDLPPTDGAAYDRGQTSPVDAARWRGMSRGRKVLALAAVSVLTAGGVAVATASGSGASNADGSGTAVGPGSVGGGSNDRADGAQGPGGLAGEQHIQGTLSAKTTDTITVKSSSGSTATYSITTGTEVARNGETTTLAAVKVGDPVLVHVLPTSSAGHRDVERLFAGPLPAGGFGPDGGRAPGDDPANPNDDDSDGTVGGTSQV